MSRLPTLDPAELTLEQRRVYDALVAGPRGGVRGPFGVLLHVPVIADRIQSLGEYLRFETSFPQRLSEMAILITGRHYGSHIEWNGHEPLAQKGGLAQSVIDAIKDRRYPENMQPDEAAIYGYTTELLHNGKISDSTYQRALDAFGTRGVVELGALIGYYMMVAMTLLAHEVPLPPGKTPPF